MYGVLSFTCQNLLTISQVFTHLIHIPTLESVHGFYPQLIDNLNNGAGSISQSARLTTVSDQLGQTVPKGPLKSLTLLISTAVAAAGKAEGQPSTPTGLFCILRSAPIV